MGFLGRMIAADLAEKALKVAGKKALYKLDDHLEKTRSVNALVEKSVSRNLLFIKNEGKRKKKRFIVWDEFDNKKCEINLEELRRGIPKVRLFNDENYEIARVELSSTRKTDRGKYTMYLDGKKLGQLSTKTSFKTIFELQFNAWKLEGNVMQTNFVVTDNYGREVIKFNDAYDTETEYVLEYKESEYEVLGLLLVMAVELSHYENSTVG